MNYACGIDFNPLTAVDNNILATAAQDIATILQWLQAATPPAQLQALHLRANVNPVPDNEAADVNTWATWVTSSVVRSLCTILNSTSPADVMQSDDDVTTEEAWCFDISNAKSSQLNVEYISLPAATGCLGFELLDSQVSLAAAHNGTGALAAPGLRIAALLLPELKDGIVNVLLSRHFSPQPLFPSLSRLNVGYNATAAERGIVWTHLNLWAWEGLSHVSNLGRFDLLVRLLRSTYETMVCAQDRTMDGTMCLRWGCRGCPPILYSSHKFQWRVGKHIIN
jgi:hypothetical protein